MSLSPTVQEVVEMVCSIPSDFHTRGDVSLVSLLEESGYDAVRDVVTASIIQQHLQTHPQLIDVWAAYSADKRCSSGWYFDDSRAATGHYSSITGRSQEQVFSERSQACAKFIKLELESWRLGGRVDR